MIEIAGINIMMMLGEYRFCINTAAYQTLTRTTEYNWESQKRLNSEPALQFMCAGSDSININGIIYPQFKGGLEQVSAMRGAAGSGKPLMLVSGNGEVFGRWCITNVSETQTGFYKNGIPQKISFALTLAKYGEDE